MNIIIAGDGKVGSMLTRQLSSEGHDITVIDSNAAVQQSEERSDVMSVRGNAASMAVLQQAGIKDADLLIAVTGADEVNLLCCNTARFLNPNLRTIARIWNPEYTDQIYQMSKEFGLSMVINLESQAAAEINRLLMYPGFLRRDTFAQGKTEIVELRVDSGSKLCNVRLMDLRAIVKCQVLVCAVLRDGNAIAPKGDFVLREGDRVFVTALSHNLSTLLKNLGLMTRRVRNVTICGGGRISYYLAKRLHKAGISVRIIEKNIDRCNALCQQLPEADVIHGNVRELSLLESERVSKTDALVTLTGQDELNMIVSLYGISRNVPQVVTKLNNGGNRSMIGDVPLGSVVSPRELICSDIVRYVRALENQTGAAQSVHSIADGQAEAMEFVVDENTRNCGKLLKEIRLKPNVLLVGVSHGADTEIANGNSRFQKGDLVVVVTNSRENIRQLNDIFA